MPAVQFTSCYKYIGIYSSYMEHPRHNWAPKKQLKALNLIIPAPRHKQVLQDCQISVQMEAGRGICTNPQRRPSGWGWLTVLVAEDWQPALVPGTQVKRELTPQDIWSTALLREAQPLHRQGSIYCPPANQLHTNTHTSLFWLLEAVLLTQDGFRLSILLTPRC